MSTSFASLVSDVMLLTNRPDLVGETKLAVKAATLKAHQADDWIKDLYENSVEFSAAEYIQSLDFKSILPRWRKPRYIRKYDAAGSAVGTFLTYLEPEEVIDGYGLEKSDIFYVAGSNIQIKSSTQLQYILLGAYLNPDITEAGYKSWIADDHPFAILYEAAAIVFKTVGHDEQNVAYREMVKEQIQQLKQHAITGLGM